MKRTVLTSVSAFLLVLAASAQEARFLPGHLAVLRAGDGVFDLNLRQAPIFVDQFDATGPCRCRALALDHRPSAPVLFNLVVTWLPLECHTAEPASCA
jgi:hypothetical protein